MSAIAIILASFLFYRYVERKHKIFILKIIGTFSLLAILILGGIWLYNEQQQKLVRNGITIEFLSKDVKVEQSQKTAWVDEVWSGADLKKSVLRIFPDKNDSELKFLKETIFAAYLPFEIKASDGEQAIVTDEEVNAFLKGGVEWEIFCKKDIERYIKDLDKLRIKNSGKFLGIIASVWGMQNWCDFPEIKAKLEKQLTPQEVILLSAFKELRDLSIEKMYDLINAQTILKTEYTFKVCNKRKVPLVSYNFEVSGSQKGRSSLKALSGNDTYSSSTKLESDLIIQPNACLDIIYTGNYKFFYNTEIRNVSGTWKEE